MVIVALATLVLGFIIGVAVTKLPINIKLSVEHREVPMPRVEVPVSEDWKTQYEDFEKSANDKKDPNNVTLDSKEDISKLFKLFNGGE